MPNPNPDIEQLIEDAVSETETSDRDRTRGKTMYIRKALVKIFRMSPEERANYKPKSGFEEAALKHLERCLSGKGYGTLALNSVRDTLGEQVSKQKEAPEKGSGLVDIVDDLPRAVRKPLAN